MKDMLKFVRAIASAVADPETPTVRPGVREYSITPDGEAEILVCYSERSVMVCLPGYTQVSYVWQKGSYEFDLLMRALEKRSERQLGALWGQLDSALEALVAEEDIA